ncbi:MAG TPA: YetF domain-containing protein, partial [Candidatus Limnocylindrales bacterium]|nr:YetF domain-containing protein [Candidatus Limnocylindrales bacterium]
NSMVGDNLSLWGGMVAVTTLLILDFALRSLSLRSPRVRKAIQGEPRLLARDGRFLERALRDEGLSEAEVEAAIRAQGLERVDQVALAVLETNGMISVIPRERDKG